MVVVALNEKSPRSIPIDDMQDVVAFNERVEAIEAPSDARSCRFQKSRNDSLHQLATEYRPPCEILNKTSSERLPSTNCERVKLIWNTRQASVFCEDLPRNFRHIFLAACLQ